MSVEHMDFKLVGGLTLEQALEIAYSDNQTIEGIYIEPPDPSELTDEDSADEDNGGLVDNLSGNQLRARAEVLIADTNEDELEDIEPIPQMLDENLKADLESIIWENGDFACLEKPFPEPNYEDFKCLTPTEIFELFFDEEVINLLVVEAMNYSRFKNCANFIVNQGEMKCFLAILILSCYNMVPGKKYYWDASGDIGNELVKNSMRRDRFISILRYIHCADNNKIDKTDTFYKLRPLMKMLKIKFLKYFIPEVDINYDESMVKYYGRHSCKQFIRGKPIRFGYKIWSLNTKSGYLINFIPYQGSDSNIPAAYQNAFGKCTAPLVTMINELDEEKRNLRYSLYFDNLFTGEHLLSYLKKMGYSGTGTIRDNRIPKDCPLPNKNSMKKKSRGEWVSTIDKTNGIIFVRWNDNNIVTVASTSYGVNPLNQVKRYSKSENRNIQITRPYCIGKYNSSMGGTDLMDENISRHRINIRGKKWWWNLFTWLVDVSVQNAWILHKNSGNTLTQLQFRREIVQTYLKRFGNPSKVGGRPSVSASSRSDSRIADDLRYDNYGHLLTQTSDGKKRRCAGEECKSIIRTYCKKCNVGLCLKCNISFHTKL